MKTYKVTLHRGTWIVYRIKAESEAEARAQALREQGELILQDSVIDQIEAEEEKENES